MPRQPSRPKPPAPPRSPRPPALAALFEPRPDADRRAAAPYRTVAAELDAVAAGDKPIAMYPLARPGDEPIDDAFLRRLARAAAERGLAVLIDPDEGPAGAPGLPPGTRGVTAYALGAGEAWRVPAIAALWRTALEDGPWSDAAERQLSYLLGYSERDRRRWIAQLRWQMAAWGARTVYALLDTDARVRVDRLGRRCLGSPPEIVGLQLFAHARGHALRRDAARRAPPGLAIARAGLTEAAYVRLFGDARRRATSGVLSAITDRRTSGALAAGVRSNVALLTAAGWR